MGLRIKNKAINPQHKGFHKFWVGIWIYLIIASFTCGIFASAVYHSKGTNEAAQEILSEIGNIKILEQYTCPQCVDLIRGWNNVSKQSPS